MNSLDSTSPPGRNSGFPLAVIIEGGLALVALVIGWLFSVPLRELLPATTLQLTSAALRGIVATLPMLAAFWWLVNSDWTSAKQLREQVDGFVDEMFCGATAAQLAFVALLAGVGEELLFRGVLQSLVGRWTTPLIAVIVVSLVFGLLHAVTRLYFVLAAVVGLYLGWLTLQYHDLMAPIVAHALYDFAALLYLSRVSGRQRAAEPKPNHEPSRD